MNADPIPLSQAAYDRIKAEHDDLVTRGKIDIARKIEAARELGDLSENGDYHAAKEEQGKMAGRINHLANLLENGVIVESSASDDAWVDSWGDPVHAWAVSGNIDVAIVKDGPDTYDVEFILDDVVFESPEGSESITILSGRWEGRLMMEDTVSYDG